MDHAGTQASSVPDVPADIPADIAAGIAADVAAQKRLLRRERTAARVARSDSEREDARTAIREAVLARCRAVGWRTVAAYVPLRTEPGSTQLLDGLAALGVRVLVPVLLPDRDLDWTVWGDGSRLGVAAVAGADTVLVPALAVAVDGTRLGRGGGSYDRALLRCATGVPVAALLFDGEVMDALPSEPWDRPVDAVVTPAGWRDLPR